MARFSNGESTFSRLARLFEALGPGTEAVTLTELSHRTGISLPAVSRMVAELVERGWLQRDPHGGFGIGFHIWELVDRGAPARELRSAAQPYMTDVQARVGHNVYLSVRQGGDVLFAEHLAAPGAVRSLAGRADRLPLHVSAPGLVLLAHAPVPVQETVLAAPLAPMTVATITDPKALRSMLSEIRRIGVAHCPGFVDPETTAIAVPLRTPDSRVTAALSVVLPQHETNRRVIPLLQRAAARIGRELAQHRDCDRADGMSSHRPSDTAVTAGCPHPAAT
jgi:DNA-binding IclR family transcriptional regulator